MRQYVGLAGGGGSNTGVTIDSQRCIVLRCFLIGAMCVADMMMFQSSDSVVPAMCVVIHVKIHVRSCNVACHISK